MSDYLAMDIFEIRRLNLKHIIERDFGGNASAFARKISKDSTYINRCLYAKDKKGKKNISDEILEAIYQSLEYPRGWLENPHWDEKGDENPTIEHQLTRLKLPERDEPSNTKIVSNGAYLGPFEEWDSDTPLDEDEVALPFFREVEMAAGNGRHQVQENHGCKLRFSKSTLKRHGVAVDSAYCVTVSGDSMSPMMPDGCVIGIDTSITAIKDRDIYAIDHNGFLRVKQLFCMPDGRIRLHSLNEDWIDEFVGGDDLDTFKVLGRVFWGSWLR